MVEKISPMLYILSCCAILLAIPSISLVIINVVLFLGTLLMSMALVKKGCSPGSLWCWSIAICGFIVTIF